MFAIANTDKQAVGSPLAPLPRHPTKEQLAEMHVAVAVMEWSLKQLQVIGGRNPLAQLQPDLNPRCLL